MAQSKKPKRKYDPLKVQQGVLISHENKRLDGSYMSRNGYVRTYRSNVNRVMNDIAKGQVSEEDLEKLHNFHQWAFATMQRITMSEIEKGWRNAEVSSLIRDDIDFDPVDLDAEDFSVTLDPEKQPVKENEHE